MVEVAEVAVVAVVVMVVVDVLDVVDEVDVVLVGFASALYSRTTSHVQATINVRGGWNIECAEGAG